jgi:hypothetical protein
MAEPADNVKNAFGWVLEVVLRTDMAHKFTVLPKRYNYPNKFLGHCPKNYKPLKNQLFIEPIKLVSNLSFSHFAELIKIADPLKRSFYEIESINGTWGVRELRRQINSLFFERTGLSRKR